MVTRQQVGVLAGLMLVCMTLMWLTNLRILGQLGGARREGEGPWRGSGGPEPRLLEPRPELRRPEQPGQPPVRHVPAAPVLRQDVRVTDAATYFQASGRRDRVYCMVPSMYKESRAKLWRAILSSWGPRCDVIKFFVDPPSDDEPPLPRTISNGQYEADLVQVNMQRKKGSLCSDGKQCRHIWEKVWRSWVWVFENDLDKAEWFLKVDDDTYFIPSNLRKFVRDNNWRADDPWYFGHEVHIEKAPWRLISGVCTAFSREAIRRLGPRLLSMEHEYGPRDNFPHSHGKCVDRDGATEERVTSKCLSEVGVYATAALEDGIKETVVPLGLPFTLTYFRKRNSTSWYWHGKPLTRGDRSNCCSTNYVWAIHGYKGTGERMLEMEQHMTGSTLAQITAWRDRAKSARQRASQGGGVPSQGLVDDEALANYVLAVRRGIEADQLAY